MAVLGLVSAVVVTCTTWDHVRKSKSSTGRPDGRQWAEPSCGREPRLRGAIYTRRTGLGLQRGRQGAKSGSSRCRIDRVALRPQTRRGRAGAGTDSHETARVTPIARALASIKECQLRFQNVRDYNCTFSKRERIKGQLTPLQRDHDEGEDSTQEHLPQVPSAFPRREAIYIVGRNDGRVLAHDVGLNKLLAGTLWLEPTGGRAMEGCRHPISEAGIGPLLETLQTRWSSELDPSESVVAFRGDQMVGTRRCTMIESTHPKQQPEFMFYRVRVFIDDELGLPIQFEAYDWPSSPGPPPNWLKSTPSANCV